MSPDDFEDAIQRLTVGMVNAGASFEMASQVATEAVVEVAKKAQELQQRGNKPK